MPSAGEEATTAPISATTAGATPVQRFGAPQRHHRAEQQQTALLRAGRAGPTPGWRSVSCTAPTVIRTGPRRSSLRVVVSSTASAARWEEDHRERQTEEQPAGEADRLPGLLQEHPDGDEVGARADQGGDPPTAG
ncbi:hypothetical protein Shyd_59970 [Streptomyces hydrogenans]|uniref:Uncharacterized protein n=1 Tax=Streptomyces hydrogenans TaxID=1873719 RepID=A0ABQ3PHY6_9ACTN|nr:hypothetical protein Shyd_59970 [Streptomyces hydrogenans]